MLLLLNFGAMYTALKWDEATYTNMSSYKTLLAVTRFLIMTPFLTCLIIQSHSLILECCWISTLFELLSVRSSPVQATLATKLFSSIKKKVVSLKWHQAAKGLIPVVGDVRCAQFTTRLFRISENQFFFSTLLVAFTLIMFLVIHFSLITEEMKAAKLGGNFET